MFAGYCDHCYLCETIMGILYIVTSTVKFMDIKWKMIFAIEGITNFHVAVLRNNSDYSLCLYYFFKVATPM